MKIKLENFQNRLILFLSIIMTGGGHQFPRPVISIIIIFLFIIKLKNSSLRLGIFNKKYNKVYIFIFTIIITTLIHSIINEKFTLSFIIRFTNILIALIIVWLYPPFKTENFISDLYFIGKIFVIHAIITFVLISINPNAFHRMLLDNDRNTFQLFHIFYYSQSPTSVIRNLLPIVRIPGLFWEPGILQIYLNIFLYISLFYIKTNKIMIILTLLAVVLTQSTMGYLIASIIISIFFYHSINYISTNKKFIYIVFIVLLLIPVSIITSKNINDKLFGENEKSFLSRKADTTAGIILTSKNPLIGIGFDNENILASRNQINFNSDVYCYLDEKRLNTNGIIMLFYSLGIPISLFIITMLYRQKIFYKHKNLFFVIIFFSLLSEPLSLLPFFFSLYLNGMVKYPPQRIVT